ncbi:hypothetical protein OEZ86_005559 [Tetradesmus obliquus]|nr:hypothetical protein OEZ86_005559 [Tetradesmus obliquus]
MSSSSSSSLLPCLGVRRLLHDLREVLDHPLPNVSCLPLDDDLYTWHGNVRSKPASVLQAVPFHFLLKFPPDYPNSPPELRLFQPIPHPNVKPVTGGIQVLHAAAPANPNSSSSRRIPVQARWRLSLWDCIPGKDSWSSGYSVHSVLLQLQVFLMDEDLHYDHQAITPAAAVAKALAFDCPQCQHRSSSSSSIHPPFATEAELDAAKQRAKERLVPKDVAALSCSCRAMQAACDDGALWQSLMAQSFPAHKLRASCLQDWKVAYRLESGAILDELRCFYSRASLLEDVLGLPLTFTVNPASQRVDYIQAHPYLLGVTAFKAGARRTPEREEFQALLPLYLTADHFNRALPHMEPLLRLLAPERVPRGGGCPPADAWLEVLPKLLNTQAVLLADNGLVASSKSLAVACQVYRLLLAVCEHWRLWPAVSSRLDTFLQSPKSRTKAATPNLGLLLPLLACSPARHSWAVMAAPLLQEAMDRKVLWMCKKDPRLVQGFQAAVGSGPDLPLLRGAWPGAAVSCKLMAFHLAFLQLVAAPKGSSLESVMDSADAFYGWPAAALGSKFSRAVQQIQCCDGWQEWFRLLGRAPPSAAAMSDVLRLAWQRSLAKGYHKKDMDFSKVQASGVSRILLKGQSYSTPPGTKTIELEVHYKWRPEHHVRYLDGAVLLFGPNRSFLEMVAWNHTSSSSTATRGAVTHSGDIMEFDQQSGKNLATLRLSHLGGQVSEAFVTLSAWSDAMLSDIIQPYVQLFEPSSGAELCQVHLDSAELATKRSHKCVIMARIFREAAGGWGVQGVGAFCQGNTGHHDDDEADVEGVGGMVAGIRVLRS